ncbi:hypothetical protein [Neisseria weaveri]|uniref:hypothetical protein n=1 Tax=Neisseria weaveri TaxID=28091 RepID=UPI000D31734B|nr:hypothetical protein [Neisseria weaveri]
MQVIQRYLTLEKFKWLCEDQGFFLAPLSGQSDPQEGIYNSEVPMDYVRDISSLFSLSLSLNTEYLEAVKAKTDETQKKIMENNRNTVFINSWFIEEKESQAMWDNYSDDNGVVLFSRTYLLYIESPGCLRGLGESLVFKDVIYDDKEKSKIHHQPAFYKNEEFSDEKEYRIIFDLKSFEMLTGQSNVYIGDAPAHEHFQKIGAISKVDLDECKKVLVPKGNGYIVKYDLSSVITEIRVNVKASEQAKKEIKELCELHHLNLDKANCR